MSVIKNIYVALIAVALLSACALKPAPQMPSRDGIIPGALAAHTEDMQPLLGRIPPETEIVIYCACPNEATAAVAALHLRRAGYRRIRPLLGGIEAWTLAGRPLAMA